MYAILRHEEKTGKVPVLGFHEGPSNILSDYSIVDVGNAVVPEGMVNFMWDFDAGGLTWDSPPTTPENRMAQLESENAALRDRQAITEAALNELIDLTLGGGA